MTSKYLLFVDATLESHAPFYNQSNLFNSWLRSYNDISEFLQFINPITEPYCIEIIIARDNIFDVGLPLSNNTQIPTLIEMFCQLKTVKHVSIFHSELNNDLERQFAKVISDPRLIKTTISLVDLRAYMCCEGINYLEAEITRCQSRNEIHLIDNLQKNIDDLKDYLGALIDNRRQQFLPVEEAYSNKPGEQAS